MLPNISPPLFFFAPDTCCEKTFCFCFGKFGLVESSTDKLNWKYYNVEEFGVGVDSKQEGCSGSALAGEHCSELAIYYE